MIGAVCRRCGATFVLDDMGDSGMLFFAEYGRRFTFCGECIAQVCIAEFRRLEGF